MAHKATLDHIEREERYNKLNPHSARKIKSYDEIYQDKMRLLYAVPLKVGFSYCGLGYKTKWSDTDYRFEWSPVFSFVFFGYQLAVTVIAPKMDHYWEAWLYYENHTDKTKSKRERIAQCRADFSQTCTVWDGTDPNGKEVDYYESILRRKYL